MRALVWGVVCAVGASVAQAATVQDLSFKDADGNRVISESVLIDAAPGEVWKLFTTDAGFAKWGAPVVHIVPGNGGTIEFALDPKRKLGDPTNVIHRIDVYEPDQLLVFHNEAIAPGGPLDPATFHTVRTLIAFEELGGKTKVTETVVGFGNSAAYDALYQHLHDGNAEYLTTLANLFMTKS